MVQNLCRTSLLVVGISNRDLRSLCLFKKRKVRLQSDLCFIRVMRSTQELKKEFHRERDQRLKATDSFEVDSFEILDLFFSFARNCSDEMVHIQVDPLLGFETMMSCSLEVEKEKEMLMSMKRQMKAVRRGLSGFTFLGPVVRFPDPRDGFSLLKWPKWKLPKKSEGTSKALGPFCLGRGNHLSLQTTSSLLPFF